jgi:hypothetical protein
MEQATIKFKTPEIREYMRQQLIKRYGEAKADYILMSIETATAVED